MRIQVEGALVFELPRVREVREKVYDLGQRQLPVDSYEQAVRWMRLWQERSEEGDPSINPNPVPRVPYLKYHDPSDGSPGVAGAPEGSPLRPIAEFAGYMGQKYGVPNRVTTAYVLTGSIPSFLVPGAWKVNTDFMRREGFNVEVEFRTPHVTRDQLNQLIATLRGFWNVKDTRLLGDRDHELIQAVEKAGGEPGHGDKTRFWKEVAEQLGISSWEAARRRAKRLQEKLVLQV